MPQLTIPALCDSCGKRSEYLVPEDVEVDRIESMPGDTDITDEDSTELYFCSLECALAAMSRMHEHWFEAQKIRPAC